MAISRVFNEIVRLASANLRRQEHQVEKVIEVLAPGPLGIVEYKFSRVELESARTEAARAREKWRRANQGRL